MDHFQVNAMTKMMKKFLIFRGRNKKTPKKVTMFVIVFTINVGILERRVFLALLILKPITLSHFLSPADVTYYD